MKDTAVPGFCFFWNIGYELPGGMGRVRGMKDKVLERRTADSLPPVPGEQTDCLGSSSPVFITVHDREKALQQMLLNAGLNILPFATCIVSLV